MILRRITEHVKDQNWTAVALDFIIVVVGVFIGIQVANWNTARQEHNLERAYLARLSTDIAESVEHFGAVRTKSINRNMIVKTFIDALDNPETTDAELVTAGRNFIVEGWPVAYFQPTRITFDELVTSGNLQIIRDEALREEITRLHKYYDRTKEGFDVNVAWLLPNDSRIIYDYDALRWDPRTATLYSERAAAEDANDLREHTAKLKRIAVSAYWFKDRALSYYDEAAVNSTVVKERIDREIGE